MNMFITHNVHQWVYYYNYYYHNYCFSWIAQQLPAHRFSQKQTLCSNSLKQLCWWTVCLYFEYSFCSPPPNNDVIKWWRIIHCYIRLCRIPRVLYVPNISLFFVLHNIVIPSLQFFFMMCLIILDSGTIREGR